MEMGDKTATASSANPFMADHPSMATDKHGYYWQPLNWTWRDSGRRKYVCCVLAIGIGLFLIVLLSKSNGQSIPDCKPKNETPVGDKSPVAAQVAAQVVAMPKREGFCPLETSAPEINHRQRVRSVASPDQRALVVGLGFINILDGDDIGGLTGYLPLGDLKNVNVSGSQEMLLVLDYECVVITFKLKQYDEFESKVDRSGYMSETKQILKAKHILIKQFKVDLKRFLITGTNKTTIGRVKIARFSPIKKSFLMGQRFSCLEPMSLNGTALRKDEVREKVIDKQSVEIVFTRLEIELDGDPDHIEKGYFSKDNYPTSCDDSNFQAFSFLS